MREWCKRHKEKKPFLQGEGRRLMQRNRDSSGEEGVGSTVKGIKKKKQERDISARHHDRRKKGESAVSTEGIRCAWGGGKPRSQPEGGGASAGCAIRRRHRRDEESTKRGWVLAEKGHTYPKKKKKCSKGRGENEHQTNSRGGVVV